MTDRRGRPLRIGVVCEPVAGHLNPALTIGRALRDRGHDVTVFGIADVAETVAGSGLGFHLVGSSEFPPGALHDRWLSHPRGPRAVVESVRLHTEETDVLCRDVPDVGRALGLDVMLVDQLHVCGPHLADAIGATLVTLCAGPGLLRAADDGFPPPFVDRAPTTSRVGRWNNRVGFVAMGAAAAPRQRVTNRHARGRGLPVRRRLRDASSSVLQISSLVPELNFGVVPPKGSPLRYVGPLIDDGRPSISFPWDHLDDRPLVYASLGTVQRGAADIRRVIATACAEAEVQLVLTLGGAETVDGVAHDGDPIVVSDAPQLDLLRRADLCITHCGMNTTMECAAFGVPMVGIPIIYDQPAVAARIRHAGLGTTIGHRDLDADALRAAIDRVLHDDRYRRRAAAVAESCRRHGGPVRAAELIEDAAASGA